MDVSSVTLDEEKSRATRKSINLSNGRHMNHWTCSSSSSSSSSSRIVVQMLLLTTLLSTFVTFCCVPIVDATFHSKNSLDSSMTDTVESTSKTSNIYAPSNVHPPPATSVVKTKASCKHKVKHHRDHSQVKGAKRSTDYWPSSKQQQQQQDKMDTRALQSVFNSFKVSPNTIIRAKESREAGARFLNETQKASREECISWCWNYQVSDQVFAREVSVKYPCNLAVYQETGHRSCYLFDCGTQNDFKCKFTSQSSYTSLLMSSDHNSLDLTAWRDQSQQERDLMHLMKDTTNERRSPSIAYDTATAASSASSSALSASLSNAPSSSSSSSASPSSHVAVAAASSSLTSASNCKHYQFACKNSSECIAIYDVCNGITQCPDGSDEAPALDCTRFTSSRLLGNEILSSSSAADLDTSGNGKGNAAATSASASSMINSNNVNTGDSGYKMNTNSLGGRSVADRIAFPFYSPKGANSVIDESGERIPLSPSGTTSPAAAAVAPMILFHYPKSANINPSSADAVKSSSSISFNVPSVASQSSPYLRRYSPLLADVAGKSNLMQSPQQQQQQQQIESPALTQQQLQLQSQVHSSIDNGKYYPSSYYGSSSSIASQMNALDFARANDLTRVSNVANVANYPLNGGGGGYITSDGDFNAAPNMQNTPYYWSLLSPPNAVDSMTAAAAGAGNGLSISKYPSSGVNALESSIHSRGNSLDSWSKDGDNINSHRDASDRVSSPSFTPEYSGKDERTGDRNVDHKTRVTSSRHESNNHAVGDTAAAAVAKMRSPSFIHGLMLPPRVSSVNHLRENNGRDTNSAVIALSLGLLITVMLIGIVGVRMRTIKRRISRRGGRSSLTHDADYLINGMYL